MGRRRLQKKAAQRISAASLGNSPPYRLDKQQTFFLGTAMMEECFLVSLNFQNRRLH
jgi:hypothetical protein